MGGIIFLVGGCFFYWLVGVFLAGGCFFVGRWVVLFFWLVGGFFPLVGGWPTECFIGCCFTVNAAGTRPIPD